MALVEMGMAIHQAGPDLAPIKRDPIPGRAQGGEGGDAAILNADIHPRQGAIANDAGIGQPIGAAAGLGDGGTDFLHQRRSPAPALSCQRRNKRWESSDSARKMTMPVPETSTSAANISGICNW